MQVSHSRIEQFENCKFKYKLRYLDKIKTIPNDDPQNALFLGTALHTGIEKNVDEAIKQYYMSYPVITDAHVNEATKLESLLPKAAALIPEGEHEVKLENEHFIGFIDLLAPATVFERGVEVPNQYDLYDFKYSNNVSNYMDSRQLHEYKYFFELLNPGKKIRNIYFLFVPKVNIKQKKTEDLSQFRKRLQEELDKAEPKLVKIDYDYTKVIDFMFGVKGVLEEQDFPKEPGWLCRYCEYEQFCMKGEDYMLLPKNERRNIEKVSKRKIWIYGDSFTGKTTMLDDAPNPLNLNTDGNIQFVTMPYQPIADQVTVTGRMTNRKFAWEVFKENIAELEKKQNDFETIIVDLVDDTREMCRVFMYDKLGIQHESDSGFGKGWDIIKTEYLSTMRRFFNLPYENLVIVSKEDVSKDITKKSGEKITRIMPSIQDAVANKLAGMVDIVARAVVEDDDSRTLSFKANEVIFGGGRLTGVSETKIPLSWNALMEVYDEANKAAVAKMKGESTPDSSKSDKAKTDRKGRGKKETTPEPEIQSDEENVSSDNTSEPDVPTQNDDEPVQDSKVEDVPVADAEPAKDEVPKTRNRKRRGEN